MAKREAVRYKPLAACKFGPTLSGRRLASRLGSYAVVAGRFAGVPSAVLFEARRKRKCRARED